MSDENGEMTKYKWDSTSEHHTNYTLNESFLFLSRNRTSDEFILIKVTYHPTMSSHKFFNYFFSFKSNSLEEI